MDRLTPPMPDIQPENVSCTSARAVPSDAGAWWGACARPVSLAQRAPAVAGLLPCWAHDAFHNVEAIGLQVAPADGGVICDAAIGGDHIAIGRVLQQSPALLHGKFTTSRQQFVRKGGLCLLLSG